MSFDLGACLRRLKPEQRTARLRRRPDTDLAFVSEPIMGGPELLLDTCVYIDVLQRRAPDALKALLAARLSNHSGVALAELTHLFGRLDPNDVRTPVVLSQIRGVLSDIPDHRLHAPSLRVLGEAGILSGIIARLAGIGPGSDQTLLNDSMLFLQAVEQGHTIVTRNIRDFVLLHQLVPHGRVLFYRVAF